MIADFKRVASASALAKILGIEFSKHKEFKELLEASDLYTIDETYVVKNRTVEYKAYNVIEALEFAYDNLILPVDVKTEVQINI